MEFKPPFIDVTTSREEFIYVDKGNGLLDKKTNQNAPWNLGICASIKHKYNVGSTCICGGFRRKKPNIYGRLSLSGDQ
jgi:methylenetetrahydrofolate reductase (NADPH)